MKIIDSKNKGFKIGKCYRHSGGEEMCVLGKLNTTLYGRCLIAESSNSCNLKPIGEDEQCIVGWKEISYADWMKNFS